MFGKPSTHRIFARRNMGIERQRDGSEDDKDEGVETGPPSSACEDSGAGKFQNGGCDSKKGGGASGYFPDDDGDNSAHFAGDLAQPWG